MKNYIGTKIIKAKLMTLSEYKKEKYGLDATINESDNTIQGYMVLYPPIGGEDIEPYKSWSPKQVFEKAYREIDNTEISLINGFL